MWIELFRALVVGVVVGVIFAATKLPIPAPTAFAGVVGIFGIYIGYRLFTVIFKI